MNNMENEELKQLDLEIENLRNRINELNEELQNYGKEEKE